METQKVSCVLPCDVWCLVGFLLAWHGAPHNLRWVNRVMYQALSGGLSRVVRGAAGGRAYEKYIAQTPNIRYLQLDWSCPGRAIKLSPGLRKVRLTIAASCVPVVLRAEFRWIEELSVRVTPTAQRLNWPTRTPCTSPHRHCPLAERDIELAGMVALTGAQLGWFLSSLLDRGTPHRLKLDVSGCRRLGIDQIVGSIQDCVGEAQALEELLLVARDTCLDMAAGADVALEVLSPLARTSTLLSASGMLQSCWW